MLKRVGIQNGDVGPYLKDVFSAPATVNVGKVLNMCLISWKCGLCQGQEFCGVPLETASGSVLLNRI